MPFGVYVHVPFCARRCDYCDFATWTDRHHLMADYVGACLDELEIASMVGDLRPASSVFFGGGTPSLLPADMLCRILEAIECLPEAEVTVECNPDTVTAELLDTYLASGVNRISVGAQSMRPHVLSGLGRQHGPTAVTDAVRLLVRAGVPTYNLDLIFGGPGETDEDWRRTLEEVLALGPPPHISAYALTPEPGTPLGRDASRHPDDDALADRYAIADEVLSGAGLAWYEISNWAMPGHECRHNLLYWQQGDYRGIGCAAHSHLSGRRFWNVRTPERYISTVDKARNAPTPPLTIASGQELLGEEERARERLELSLRTRAGVPDWSLPADVLLDRLVVRSAGRAVLSLEGRLLANEVAVRLTIPEGALEEDKAGNSSGCPELRTGPFVRFTRDTDSGVPNAVREEIPARHI